MEEKGKNEKAEGDIFIKILREVQEEAERGKEGVIGEVGKACAGEGRYKNIKEKAGQFISRYGVYYYNRKNLEMAEHEWGLIKEMIKEFDRKGGGLKFETFEGEKEGYAKNLEDEGERIQEEGLLIEAALRGIIKRKKEWERVWLGITEAARKEGEYKLFKGKAEQDRLELGNINKKVDKIMARRLKMLLEYGSATEKKAGGRRPGRQTGGAE